MVRKLCDSNPELDQLLSVYCSPQNKNGRVQLDPRVVKALAYSGIGRNDKCQCGSGKKFKKCCGISK